MSDRGSMSVQSLRGFVGLVKLEGLDPTPVFTEAGIVAEDLADIDGRLEIARCEALASAVMMRLSERQILSAFSRLKAGDSAFSITSSATVARSASHSSAWRATRT